MAVDTAIKEVLDVRRLSLPPGPPVISVEPEEYVDFSGNEALRVWVVLDENTDVTRLSGQSILKLKSAIHDSLIQHGIDLFPYIFLIKESERRSESAQE